MVNWAAIRLGTALVAVVAGGVATAINRKEISDYLLNNSERSPVQYVEALQAEADENKRDLAEIARIIFPQKKTYFIAENNGQIKIWLAKNRYFTQDVDAGTVSREGTLELELKTTPFTGTGASLDAQLILKREICNELNKYFARQTEADIKRFIGAVHSAQTATSPAYTDARDVLRAASTYFGNSGEKIFNSKTVLGAIKKDIETRSK